MANFISCIRGFFGGTCEEPPNIHFGIMLSKHGEYPYKEVPLNMEQWKRVIDKIRGVGIKRVTIIPDIMNKDAIELIKYSKGMNGTFIVNSGEITPEIAIELQRTDFSFTKLLVADMSEKEVRGVKTAVASGLNVIVVFTEVEIIDKFDEHSKKLYEFGIDESFFGTIAKAMDGIDLLANPNGDVYFSGKKIGNILTDDWEDITGAMHQCHA